MKENRQFITIEFDYVPGLFDYPKNVPLPRIGGTIVFENNQVNRAGKVYDVRHIITGNIADIKIKVQ